MRSGQASIRKGSLVLLVSLLTCAPTFGATLTLSLSETAERTAILRESYGSYALPIGPWFEGAMLTRRTEGAKETSAWRIEAPGASTLELLTPLRARLIEEGFDVLFECDAADCGGFDFRYSTAVLPEPEMHVDLGDYRFVAAERGQGEAIEHVTLLVSRSKLAGFVQMIRVTPAVPGDTPIATKAPVTETAAPLPGPDISADPTAEALLSGVLVLEGLNFATGTADLGTQEPDSLARLARFLTSEPETRIALVGHTDASGSLEANRALSQRRAEAVRQYLLRQHKIAPDRIEAHGIGYLAPRASNATEEGRALNRRVEVVLTSTR